MLIEGNNLDVIIASLNSKIDKINTWLRANKLSLNVTKTHYMVFHRVRRNANHNQIFLNNSVLTQIIFIRVMNYSWDEVKWDLTHIL